MKITKYDVLFGEVYTRNNINTIQLSNITNASNRLQPRELGLQLNRLLRQNNGEVEAVDSTSSPDFYLILDKLLQSDVHCIYIGKRTDQNNSVKATLDCSLFLNDGLLKIVPQWCAYKEIRANEIVSSLIEPIFRNALLDRVYIDYGQNKYENLPSSVEEASGELFALSGYPK